MDELSIPPGELPVRQRFLDELRSYDRSGEGRISADNFQAVLRHMGLRFGDPVVDRIMLQCTIDGGGNVDFWKFHQNMNRHREAPDSRDASSASGARGDHGYDAPASMPASARGAPSMTDSSYEFRTALEATTGAVLPASSMPAELASLPQSERVRVMSRELAALFTQLDTNRITLDHFRAQLRNMGLMETPEVTRLLHQPPLKFSTLYRALQSDPADGPTGDRSFAPSKVELFRPVGSSFPRGGHAHVASSSYTTKIGASGDEHIPTAGRQYSTRPGTAARSYNPITGEGTVGDNETAAMRIDRGAHVGAYNTAVAGDITRGASSASGKAREDRRVLYEESGASNIMYNKGENKPGVEYGEHAEGAGYRMNKELYKKGRGARGDKAYLAEEGAGHLIRGGDGHFDTDTTDARFESHTQAAQRTGLWGKADESHRPATSAGYRTLDRGLLREQVYSAVRTLDSGDISVRQFRSRVADLGIELPPAVERLLQSYSYGAAAAFPVFVKAFEGFFDAATTRDPAAASADARSPRAPSPRGYGTAGMRAREDGAGWGAAASSPAPAPARADRPAAGTREAARASGAPYATGAYDGGFDGRRPATASAAAAAAPAIERAAMLTRDDASDLSQPVRPSSAYQASGDRRTFAEGHTSGGAYYSTHVHPYQRGHGDILGWSTPATSGEAEQHESRRRAPDRRLYDFHSPAVDLMSVEQRGRFGDSVHELATAAGPRDPHFRDLTARRNVHPDRYRDAGNFIAWSGTSGGTYGPEHTEAEMSQMAGKGKARVASELGYKERAGLDEPYARR